MTPAPLPELPHGPGPTLDWLWRAWAALVGPYRQRRPVPRPRRPVALPALPRPSLGVGGQAFALALVIRVALAGIVWLSLRIFPRFPRYPGQLRDGFFPDHPALDGWARWDAAHYVAIARVGYGGDNPSPDGGLGFFPLFPLLMRGAVAAVGAAPTPAALALAGIAIANVCFLLAVPLVARAGAAVGGPTAGRTAALLLCVSPFALFFGAAYSESLFLLLAVGALTLANRGRWWWAGLVAGFASGTRLVGLALLPALLLLALRRRTTGRDQLGVVVLSPAGALLFFAYTARAYGDPFAYFRAQAAWGGWTEHVRFYAELFAQQPGDAIGTEPRHLMVLLNLGVAVLFLALLPRVWRTLDPATALFTTLLVVVQAALTWVSLGRYVLPAVGVYLVAGALLARPRFAGWPRDAVVVGSTLVLAVLAVLHAHGYWVV